MLGLLGLLGFQRSLERSKVQGFGPQRRARHGVLEGHHRSCDALLGGGHCA